MQLIPLDNSPNQTFTISLSVDGSTLTLKLGINFSSMAGYWLMTVWDASGKCLLSSVPLLTGVWPASNILAQFGYLRIGSAYLISNGSLADYPDSTNLGSEFELWWGDTA
jgi:hypothetical protein